MYWLKEGILQIIFTYLTEKIFDQWCVFPLYGPPVKTFTHKIRKNFLHSEVILLFLCYAMGTQAEEKKT